MLKSNPDLTTIGNIVVSVAALSAMTALLITRSIDLTVAGYFLAFVAALNGFTGALKAPSPQQAADLVTALASSGPINPGPLVQIHTTPADGTQVSGVALPAVPRTQEPQPIILPQPANNVPPGQGTLTMMPPQGTAVQTGTWPGFVPPTEAPPQQQQQPFQVDRNWTGLVPVPPTQQP